MSYNSPLVSIKYGITHRNSCYSTGSPVMVQLEVEVAQSSLCLSQLSSHEYLPHLSSSQSPPQQSSALYLPQLSSTSSPPHPSYLCVCPSLLHSPSLQSCMSVQVVYPRHVFPRFLHGKSCRLTWCHIVLDPHHDARCV